MDLSREQTATTDNLKYARLQREYGLYIGQIVTIKSRDINLEKGWDNVWIDSMDNMVDMIGVIILIDDYRGVLVEFDNGKKCTFPYGSIEKGSQVTVTLEIKVGKHLGSLTIPFGVFEGLQKGDKFEIINHKINV